MDERQLLIERGKQAQALLENPFFDYVVKEVEAGLIESILSTEPHETKKREGLYAEHRGLKNIVATLSDFVTVGALEEEQDD